MGLQTQKSQPITVRELAASLCMAVLAIHPEVQGGPEELAKLARECGEALDAELSGNAHGIEYKQEPLYAGETKSRSEHAPPAPPPPNEAYIAAEQVALDHQGDEKGGAIVCAPFLLNRLASAMLPIPRPVKHGQSVIEIHGLPVYGWNGEGAPRYATPEEVEAWDVQMTALEDGNNAAMNVHLDDLAKKAEETYQT